MSNFPNVIRGIEGEQFNTTSDQRYALGTLMVMDDGREFRYAKTGAVALVAGKLCQASAPIAGHQGLALPAAVSVGARTLVVTNGATAITTDQYKDGYLNIEDDSGEGRLYKIKSNTADAGNGPVTITLAEGASIKKALTTLTTVGLLKNRLDAVIAAPTALTGALAGVAVSDAAIGAYCWLQTKGYASVLTEGTLVIGQSAVPSVTTSGCVTALALTEGAPNTGAGQHVVGEVVKVSVTTENSVIDLNLR